LNLIIILFNTNDFWGKPGFLSIIRALLFPKMAIIF
jgi:hypothetical protein